jgi:hypothetical protein
MPPRKRRLAGAPALDADGGDGAGPGPSSERAAAAAAGLLDVLEAAVLVELLDRESKRALRMASKAACAAVERMATCMELQASAQHDTAALLRLAGKLPNVHSLTCNSNEKGAAGFMAVASLLGEFVASRPNAAAGVRIVGLELRSQTLGCELPLVVSPFCNLQASSPTSIARSRCRQTAHFPFLRPNAIGANQGRCLQELFHWTATGSVGPSSDTTRIHSTPARCRQTYPPVADTPTHTSHLQTATISTGAACRS